MRMRVYEPAPPHRHSPLVSRSDSCIPTFPSGNSDMETQCLTVLITLPPCIGRWVHRSRQARLKGSRDLFVFVSLRNIVTFKCNPAEDPPKACVQPKERYGPGWKIDLRNAVVDPLRW